MVESWSENGVKKWQKQMELMRQRRRVTGGQRGCVCFLHMVRLWHRGEGRLVGVSLCHQKRNITTPDRRNNEQLRRARVEHLSAKNIKYQKTKNKKKSLESPKMSQFRWHHFHRWTTQMQWWETVHGRWLVRPSTIKSYHPALKCSRALQAAQEKAKSRQLSSWQGGRDSLTQYEGRQLQLVRY